MLLGDEVAHAGCVVVVVATLAVDYEVVVIVDDVVADRPDDAAAKGGGARVGVAEAGRRALGVVGAARVADEGHAVAEIPAGVGDAAVGVAVGRVAVEHAEPVSAREPEVDAGRAVVAVVVEAVAELAAVAAGAAGLALIEAQGVVGVGGALAGLGARRAVRPCARHAVGEHLAVGRVVAVDAVVVVVVGEVVAQRLR